MTYTVRTLIDGLADDTRCSRYGLALDTFDGVVSDYRNSLALELEVTVQLINGGEIDAETTLPAGRTC